MHINSKEISGPLYGRLVLSKINELKLTQSELAITSEIASGTITRLVNGKTKFPKQETFEAINSVLDLKTEEIEKCVESKKFAPHASESRFGGQTHPLDIFYKAAASLVLGGSDHYDFQCFMKILADAFSKHQKIRVQTFEKKFDEYRTKTKNYPAKIHRALVDIEARNFTWLCIGIGFIRKTNEHEFFLIKDTYFVDECATEARARMHP